MSLNNFPAAISNVIEQIGYLDKYYHDALRGQFGYRDAANKEKFEARIGETKTFSRPAALTAKTSPLNPAANAGLDNGLTPSQRSFEQWNAVLNKYADGLDLNIEEETTLIADLFVNNEEELARGAGLTMDYIAAQRMHRSYETGDTYALGAVTAGNSVHVDNGYGFDTQYLLTALAPSYGLPVAVSPTNKIPILVLGGSSGTVAYAANVTSIVWDTVNISSAQTAGVAIGASAVLGLDGNITCAIGDRIVAMDPSASTTVFNPQGMDGSFVLRPNSKQTRYQLTETDTLTYDMVATAVGKLKSRGIPPLRNGLYMCTVDALVIQQLYADDRFNTATMGQWDRSPVFTNGKIAKGLGVEFVEANTTPAYTAPGGGFMIRHAIVYGRDALTEYDFQGQHYGVNRVKEEGGATAVIKWIDGVEFIIQSPLDRMQEVIKSTYKWVGDFESGTDKGSNPTIFGTTDWCRFKRAVEIEVASAI
jgi:hypothetical protein